MKTFFVMAVLGATLLACACSENEEGPSTGTGVLEEIPRAAVFGEKPVASKFYGEACEGASDCRTGMCMHMDHGNQIRSPMDRWFCTKECKSHGDCGHGQFKCVEWYPGKRTCVAGPTWVSQKAKVTP